MTGTVRGRLVALEGIDGAGTSTQVPLLADHLRAQGLTVLTTAEPTGGEVGRLLRRALRRDIDLSEACMALLFAADRLDHLAQIVEPALAAGTWVVSDRCVLSSYAYQAAALSGAWLEAINGHARLPDLIFYLRISVATAGARRAQRRGQHERYEAEHLQAAAAAGYERCCSTPGPVRVVAIDGEPPIAAVQAALQGALAEALHVGVP